MLYSNKHEFQSIKSLNHSSTPYFVITTNTNENNFNSTVILMLDKRFVLAQRPVFFMCMDPELKCQTTRQCTREKNLLSMRPRLNLDRITICMLIYSFSPGTRASRWLQEVCNKSSQIDDNGICACVCHLCESNSAGICSDLYVYWCCKWRVNYLNCLCRCLSL